MNLKFIGFAVVSVVTLSACAIDPYTQESRTSNTGKGAAGGALLGALIGAVADSDNRESGAIKGGLAGAALGAGAGLYMDRQAAKLRAELEYSGVKVERTANGVRLVMPGDVTFASGRADVQSEFYSVLTSVAKVAVEFDETTVRISGHTDSVGASEYNQTLSEQRARSVAAYLINQGVASGRVFTTGSGERYPVASNDTASGRSANRRVEIDLEPLR